MNNIAGYNYMITWHAESSTMNIIWLLVYSCLEAIPKLNLSYPNSICRVFLFSYVATPQMNVCRLQTSHKTATHNQILQLLRLLLVITMTSTLMPLIDMWVLCTLWFARDSQLSWIMYCNNCRLSIALYAQIMHQVKFVCITLSGNWLTDSYFVQ